MVGVYLPENFRIICIEGYSACALDGSGHVALIYMIIRRGPRIDPCGTPDATSVISDFTPLMVVNCFLLVK